MRYWLPIVIAGYLLAGIPLHAQEIDVLHYKAEVEFNLLQEIIMGTVDITVRNPGTESISTIPLHLVNLTVSDLETGDTPLTYNQSDGDLYVTLNAPLAAGDSVVLTVSYNGHAVAESGPSSWGGCFWNMDGVSFVMGVGFYAEYVSMMRHWLPSNDIPSDKATFDVTFTVPESLYVAGAGVLASVTQGTGTKSYRWVESHPTATYLFNYSIADYVRIDDSWNGIPLVYYVLREDSLKGTTFFSTVGGMLEAFTARYGNYPFDKVGYCLTPIGAMEHQTMISYPQSMFEVYSHAGSTAAHELAHQWWGDYVTPADFKNTWLSEGFAVFSEMVYQEYHGDRDTYINAAYSNIRTYKSYVAPQEGIFPLYDYPHESPSSNYPQTIYKKGGAVLVMLREVMGEDDFFEGLREYGKTYAYNSATTLQFQQVMESYYGESLDWFFDEWVYKKGWPEYKFTVLKDEGQPLKIRIDQQQDPSEYPLYKMPIPVTIRMRSLAVVPTVIMTEALATQTIEFASIESDSVLSVTFDPENLILCRKQQSTTGTRTPDIPDAFAMEPGYPNPVHAGTTAVFAVTFPESIRMGISIYDTMGRFVQSMEGKEYTQGMHAVSIPTDSLHAGTYWIHFHSAGFTAVQRMDVR